MKLKLMDRIVCQADITLQLKSLFLSSNREEMAPVNQRTQKLSVFLHKRHN